MPVAAGGCPETAAPQAAGFGEAGPEVLLEESEEMRQVTPPGRRWPARTPTPSAWGTLDLEAQHAASSSKPQAPGAG